jgi:hypothetical protein
LKHRVREHGHATFFPVAQRTTTILVHDLLTNYHMFSVDDVIVSYDERTAHVTTKTDDMFEELEMDDMGLYHIVGESLLID